MGAYARRFKIQDEHFIAYPGKITHGQLPGEMDFYLRLDDYAPADVCAKHSENETFKPRRHRQRGEEKKALGDMPDGFNHEWASAIQSSRPVKQVISYNGH